MPFEKHEKLFASISQAGLVPVIKIEDASKAEGLANALLAGGIGVAEVTFRSQSAEEAMRIIAEKVPQMLLGAGTVINLELARKAKAAGAKFLVSPGFNPAVVDWAIENDIPIFPGVCTPSDIEQGLARGLKTLKFFPAEASGGVEMLKNFAGPFSQVKFMPTGGINAENLQSYIKLKNVLAVGGSWMVKPELVDNGRWDEITSECSKAVAALQGFKLIHVGINTPDKEAALAASRMLELFGMATKVGNSSTFMDKEIELMHKMYLGANGHLGFSCNSVERALGYLERFGFKPVESTFAYTDDKRLKVAYLAPEVAGFAIHLVLA